ncbi:MAG: hypothetical protein ABI678_24245 [Kofleriaceae bacterium]
MGTPRAAALALIATTAIAPAPPTPTPVQIQQAGDLVKKAIAKSQAGDHTLAIELYQQAYNIIPTPILLSNIGSEYQQAQKPADAVKYFCKYLDAEPNGGGVTFASNQVKSLQIQLGNDVDDATPCKVVPKLAPTPPTVTATEALTGTAPFGETGGPVKDEPGHPGRALEYTGVAVMIASAVPLAIGIGYAWKGHSLTSQIDGHNPNDPWPETIDGIPLLETRKVGEDYNRKGWTWGIVGGAGLVIGGTLVDLDHRQGDRSSTEHARIVPTAGAHDAGIAVLGRF